MSDVQTKNADRGPRAAWGLVAFLAGAGTMLFELVAPRMMQPWFGASTYVWTNVIGVILLALALGYELGGRLAERGGRPRRITISLAAAAAFALALIPVLPAFAAWLLPEPQTLSAFSEGPTWFALDSLLTAVFLFAPPVFLLASVAPQVVRELVETGMPSGRAAGRVFMLGTLGSLVGTFLPTYLLVPALGTRLSMVVAALVLSIGALVAMRGRRELGKIAALLVIGGLIALPGFGRPLRPALDETQELVLEDESPLQYLRVVRGVAPETSRAPRAEQLKELVLQINEGVHEFHSLRTEGRRDTISKYYDYFALLPAFIEKKNQRVLVLGSGTGTMSRLLRDLWGDRIEQIVNVELDPAVVALEERFDPGGDRSMVKTLTMDGRAALRGLDERFDLILVDAYARQVDIPFHMATVEFFRLAKQRLTEDGLVAINASVRDPEDFTIGRALVRSMREVGFVEAVPVLYWGNTMLVANPGEGPRLDVEPFAEPPEELRPELDHLRTAGAGRRDMPVDETAPLLTDDHAPIERLTGLSIEEEAVVSSPTRAPKPHQQADREAAIQRILVLGIAALILLAGSAFVVLRR